MVVNESEAVRWVNRQWQRLSGKDEISGVDEMLLPSYLLLLT